MTELYELDLTAVSAADVSRWLGEMDEESRARIMTISQPHRRTQSAAGDHLARTALAQQSGKMPCDIVIRRTAEGKPYAIEGHFGISHSGDFVVCAVSEHPVGVDVERIRKCPLRVAQRYFTEEERERLKDDELEFWRIWTGKEALCKLTGEGIAGLKHCDTACPPEGVRLTTTDRDGYVVTVAEVLD